MSYCDQFDEDRRMCGLDDHDDILEAEHQLLTGLPHTPPYREPEEGLYGQEREAA